MRVPNEDKKDILWLALLSGVFGGLTDGCDIDAIVGDVDPEIFEDFFLDE
jgi:hypothetical protein